MASRLSPVIALIVGVSLAVSGCASREPVTPADGGHGAIAGAREMSEPQLGLVLVDASGTVSHLDLLDESVATLGSVPAPTGSATDGRYVFSIGAAGVSIIDSGRWTWDHVDHFHYYLADPRILGTVEGRGPATVATTTSSTSGGTGVYFAETGDAVLLDTQALSRGEIVERFRLETAPHPGLVVPIGSFALVTTARDGIVESVAAVDGEGMPVPGATAPCLDARGTITTRVGAVVGCADGVLLATVADGSVAFEHIPYPAGGEAHRATAFSGRDGRPTVAALAGDAGIWLLDTRARSWTLLPVSTPLSAVTAVDDEVGHVLALATDGRLLVIDGSTGAVRAETAPLVAESLSGGIAPVLFADQNRAYVTGPAEGTVSEIDFADGARIARSFSLPSDTVVVAGSGR